MQPAELETLSQRLKALAEPKGSASLKKDDWLGALGVFLLVFLSTLPVVIPFMFMKDITLALRVSNAIAIVMLFLTGYAFGQATGGHAVRRGFLGVVLGVVLVSLTIALGG